MPTLASYVAQLPPILKQKYGDAFWISAANNILEILSSERILRELSYQKGVIVKYKKWITPPANYRQAKKLFSPTDYNSEFPFIEDDGKLMLTNATVDEDPAPIVPLVFSNSNIDSITICDLNSNNVPNLDNSWIQVAQSLNWYAVAMSSDGVKQTAVVNGGYIWVSTDSGNTWTQKATSLNWYAVAMSSDGVKQTAVVYGGYIWVSTDSGNTWTQKATSLNWYAVAMSSDGVIQTAVVKGGYIWVSTDSGNTWTQKATSPNWRGIAISSDGTVQTAVAGIGYILVSTDSGANWTQKATSLNWYAVAMSSDGVKQTAVVNGGYIWVSTDSGNTWTQKATSLNWYAVAMSSDGVIQTATVYGGYIWVSTDSGNTWTQKATSQNWHGIAISSDGTVQTAVAGIGYIWTMSSLARNQDDLKDYLLVVTAGNQAGNTLAIAGNDASVGRATKLYYYHLLSTALGIGSDITSAVIVSPDNYIMLSYKGSFVEIEATTDEIPINNNHEHQIMRAGLSMLGFEQLPSGPDAPIAKGWHTYFDKVLMKVRDEFLSGGNQTDVRSRRWIGMMDDSEIDIFPDADDV
jgi:photosystem II stability/assembly factor-like uncharacterized protein